MKIYCAWVEGEEKFDPQQHARCDVEVLCLKVQQREGEVALATLQVPSHHPIPLNARFMMISYQDQETVKPLFKGKLRRCPIRLKNKQTTLELAAEPEQLYEDLEAIYQTLKHPAHELFWPEEEEEQFCNALEHHQGLYMWDRHTGEVKLSNLFEGRESLTLTEKDIFEEGFSVRLVDTPLDHLNVEISAAWIQEAEGDIQIGSLIEGAFLDGLVNTLTGKDLIKRWPKEGPMGRSGYWITRSYLRPIEPPNTGVLGIYPTLSPLLTTYDKENEESIQVQTPRTWFKAGLDIAWFYRQKRKEIVKFQLKQSSQLERGNHRRQHTLKLHVQKISPSSEARFFATEKGNLALNYAIQVAQAHLAATARCVEIELCVPWSVIQLVSLDQTICLQSRELPGGRAQGKVLEYHMIIQADKAYGLIRLGVGLGKGEYSHDSQSQAYILHDEQVPIQGMVSPEHLSAQDFVEGIMITGQPEEQIQALTDAQYPNHPTFEGVLERCPTDLHIRLRDLRTPGVLERTIPLSILSSWSAPQQIAWQESNQ